MHLGVILHPYGSHVAAWLSGDAPLGAEIDVDHYTNVAQIAERAALDLIFFADVPAVREGNLQAIRRWPMFAAQFEPVTVLGMLAGKTSKIGLAATASTSYSEPYNLARQFASLDHLSKGRIGWNVVTTSSAAAALNFGSNPRADHQARYSRATEFLTIAKALWDSWDDDAFTRDRETGLFFDAEKLHTLNFSGEHFSVKGPLNIARPPQGHPVIIQAGGSAPGRDLAARTADVVFSAEPEIDAGRAFYKDVKDRAVAYGRDADDVKILVALMPIVGRTRSEADDILADLQERIHPDVGREIMSYDLGGIDLSDVADDDVFPMEKVPTSTQGGQSFLRYFQELIQQEGGATVKELYKYYSIARGSKFAVGSAADVADLMEDWTSSRAADGFMCVFPTFPNGFRRFTELVVPELQRRGLFRKGYQGNTLREHLRLKKPGSVYKKVQAS
ncbi:putative monooxygenase YxeK [Mesorhizobium sp. L-8-10]|nr:putative monooxygenase YxeK [Mesorhizobium sp. L-8-10]